MFFYSQWKQRKAAGTHIWDPGRMLSLNKLNNYLIIKSVTNCVIVSTAVTALSALNLNLVFYFWGMAV